MPDITLFSANPSRGLVNQWLLAEAALPYRLELLDLEKEEHKKPAYLALNPMGKVPTLQHGDVVVTESAAINMYLAELVPEQGLAVPVGSPLRGDYLRWCMFAPVTGEPSIVSTALNLQHPDYQPFADIESVAETLRQAIGTRQYIVGDAFTAADIAVGSLIYWGLNLMPVLPRHVELVEYWERLAQRPSWIDLQAST